MPTTLDTLQFDDRVVRELPADPDHTNALRQVHGAAFSYVRPTPVRAPRTLAHSREVAELLGLDEATCRSQEFADAFSGNVVLPGSEPWAAAYAGHQFGHWAGQLGDGRAIALGEVLDRNGAHQTLQLKGAGPTPYSRRADGRAVLRSSVREFLCSEAMHHLGIPTTRALSLVLTGDEVVRDMLYDGHPAPEPGAVVCRVASSFLRFGSFELPASRGDEALLRQLVAFTIANDFPELLDEYGSVEDAVAPWFAEVCRRTCALVVDWMRVGFVHGVLNTDNMSVLGLTIDYGPYGWLEGFDPNWTPNTTDAEQRRYRYGAQPQVVQWNLLQLANAILPLVGEGPEPLEAAVIEYAEQYEAQFAAMLGERLGWGAARPGDGPRRQELFELMTRSETDFVLLHRDLARVPVAPDAGDEALLEPLGAAWYEPDAITGDLRAAWLTWLRAWGTRVRDGGIVDDAERRRRMNAVNPRFVLRNWLAQEAIDAAEQGDDSLVHELLDTLRRPYDEQPGRERFSERRPEWARSRVGCSMLSCSS